MHMIMCLVAHGAPAAMQVSDQDGYTKNPRFFFVGRIRTQVNTIFRLRKIDCHGVAITNLDTSTHLVTQAYGCRTNEALGSVAAP